MGGRIVISPPLKELKEFLRPALLKQTHKWAADSFQLVAWDLGDLAITIDEAACDLLELEVAGDVGVHKDLGQFSRCHDELGYQIHGIVAIASELRGRGLVGPELAVELLQRGHQCHTTDTSECKRTWVRFKLALSPP